MSASVIGARLDLLVRLVDTTTGAEVKERNVLFLKDGQLIRPEPRGTGMYVFINTGREDFLMQIRVFGYDECTVPVSYASLDQRMPVCDVFLMPSESMSGWPELIDFKGNLPFLETIEAVNLNRPLCNFQAYDQKKNLMSVYNASGGSVYLDTCCYGLVSREKASYETIEVTGTVTSQSFHLKNPLAPETVQGLMICRIIYGRATKEGDYVLRVRDDAKDLIYLVRYQVKGEERFQILDFRNQEVLK
ncbi:MAG: hypothetical protein K6G83_11400 [Lachnospiraceae bacterium]|nr:hypothetical protein [Lachnospiraceae bacterium]